MTVEARLGLTPEEIAAFCRRHHIRKFAIFGSVLREDFAPESDVDVLVDFDPDHIPGLEFVDIKEDLEGLLGRTVDLLTFGALRNPFRRAEIMRTHRVIYARPGS